MASWTSDHSMILSRLLDEVTGTQEMIDARQDHCRMVDCLESKREQNNIYFTGSKAEGLDLPGSDTDLMHDVNGLYDIRVIQSLDENIPMTYGVFLMSTENMPAGFTLLQHVHPTPSPLLYCALQNMNGLGYLSSDLFLQMTLSTMDSVQTSVPGSRVKRQGPSMELGSELSENAESGVDFVPSIHCDFWPNEANEWVRRQRHFQWPTPNAISSIIDFGFHLVPVGHPLSDMKPMEWRLSFSMAERALVWSFNHIQMQCYALLKIIQKEFIKVRCNPQNQVLCSYFIKTFLFWKYETTELSFWREDNLRHCTKFLLVEFSKCIQEGVISHYFIPRFNLLSIKLTRAAQAEILQLLDIITQSDISILKECRTLHSVWSEFLSVRENPNNAICKVRRRNIVMNDVCMNKMADDIYTFLDFFGDVVATSHSLADTIDKMMRMLKTPLQTLVLGKCLLEKNIRSTWINFDGLGNKGLYQLHRFLREDIFSSDISTCKLWCAILFFKKGEYLSTLGIVNQVLSIIPPFAIYHTRHINNKNDDAKQLYVDMFWESDSATYQRARKAWMFDLRFNKDIVDALPLAFQIELYFCERDIEISPFICAYYLQFMCYHMMQRYDERNRSLEQLLEVVFNREQCGDHFTSFNIAGHCLLLAGKTDQARKMFDALCLVTQMNPLYGNSQSASWYLQNFC